MSLRPRLEKLSKRELITAVISFKRNGACYCFGKLRCKDGDEYHREPLCNLCRKLAKKSKE